MNSLNISIFSLFFAISFDIQVIFRQLADDITGFILKACAEESCETQDVSSNKSCANKGGMSCAYYTCYENIDIDATSALVTDTGTDCTLDGYVMVGGATWSTLAFAKKSGTYSFNYTADQGAYELLVDMIFEGKDSSNTKAFCKLVDSCNFVMQIFDRNCNGRAVGFDWTDGQLQELADDFQVNTHTDSSGAFEGDSPQDALQWRGLSDCAPLFTSFTKADFEANYL